MEWTDEQIRECYRAEVAKRFDFENESHREMDRLDIASLHPAQLAKLPEHMHTPSDSFFYEMYKATTIDLASNVATISFPARGYAFGRDFLRMFDNTEVAWGLLCVSAEPYADEEGKPAARVTGDVTLVDSWDDDRSRAWRARHPCPPKFCDWGRFEDRERRLRSAAERLARLAREEIGLPPTRVAAIVSMLHTK